MELRAMWRRATRWIGGAADRRAAREVADAAERVVGRAAARARLAAVEAEIVALMADDRVPARGPASAGAGAGQGRPAGGAGGGRGPGDAGGPSHPGRRRHLRILCTTPAERPNRRPTRGRTVRSDPRRRRWPRVPAPDAGSCGRPTRGGGRIRGSRHGTGRAAWPIPDVRGDAVERRSPRYPPRRRGARRRPPTLRCSSVSPTARPRRSTPSTSATGARPTRSRGASAPTTGWPRTSCRRSSSRSGATPGSSTRGAAPSRAG